MTMRVGSGVQEEKGKQYRLWKPDAMRVDKRSRDKDERKSKMREKSGRRRKRAEGARQGRRRIA